ncbi:MAG: polysaccharide lyase 6 family protein [Bacteroidales bacterium]|nr:polysaccharide lyase 6 family protein [Bacteroidales bacterium]
MNRVINNKQSAVGKLEIVSSGFVRFILLICLLSNTLSIEATNYLIYSASELTSITSSLQAGDTVKLSKGNWYNQELLFTAFGTADENIVLTVEVKGETILTGTSQIRIYGEHLTIDGLRFENGSRQNDAVVEFRKSSSELSHHCRLTNTSIINYNPADKNTDYKWVSVYGTNNRVDHCHFEGKNHSGTTLVVWITDEPNYTHIDHNYFGTRPDLGYNGGETIRIGTSTNSMKESRAIVEYNLFEECDGEIEIISNKSCFNIYRYNTFRNNNGCLTLRHGNDCEVYGNYFTGGDKASGGVRIIGERHKVYNNYFENLKGDDYRSAICIMNGVPDSPLNRYFQVKEAVVAFNTIVNCKMPLIIGAGKDSEKSLAPIDCIFANNVIDKTTGSVNITIEDEPVNMVWESNVINGNANDEQITTGINYENPSLEYEGYMWRPSANSMLRNAGTGTYDYIETDIEQDIRSESKTVGCDNGSVNGNWHPLSISDVGPYSVTNEEKTGLTYVLVDDMVNVRRINGICYFSKQGQYHNVTYNIYNVSGQILDQGVLRGEKVFKPNSNGLYLALFSADNKYLQRFKIISANNLM